MSSSYGGFSIDRFASDYNKKCSRFNSRWWVLGCEKLNSLELSWEGENNWLVPPPNLILECLNKIKNDNFLGVLVIPEWKGAVYWPFVQNLLKNGRIFEIAKLPKNCIQPGRGNNGIFQKVLNFEMLAFGLKIS